MIPVLPPLLIPDALSAAATVGLVPNRPERNVATEPPTKVFLNLLRSGSSPSKRPIDSKIRIIDMENVARRKGMVKELEKSPFATICP